MLTESESYKVLAASLSFLVLMGHYRLYRLYLGLRAYHRLYRFYSGWYEKLVCAFAFIVIVTLFFSLIREAI